MQNICDSKNLGEGSTFLEILYTITSFVNVDSFISSYFFFYFLTLMHWLEFSTLCWISVVKGKILFLFSILGGSIQSFTIKYSVFCSCSFISSRQCLSILIYSVRFGVFSVNFHHKWVVKFLKCFYCIDWYNQDSFLLLSINIVDHTDWFSNIRRVFLE